MLGGLRGRIGDLGDRWHSLSYTAPCGVSPQRVGRDTGHGAVSSEISLVYPQISCAHRYNVVCDISIEFWFGPKPNFYGASSQSRIFIQKFLNFGLRSSTFG